MTRPNYDNFDFGKYRGIDDPRTEQPTDATRLADCPIGLFWHGETLCLKTEYGNNEGRIDAYIVESGEFYWGDHPQTIANQRRQMVVPVDTDFALAALAMQAAAPTPNGEGVDTMLDEDGAVLAMLYELHSHMPEADRPMSLSDLSDEQTKRARAAVRAITRGMLFKPATPINSEGLDALVERVRELASDDRYSNEFIGIFVRNSLAALEAVRAGDGR